MAAPQTAIKKRQVIANSNKTMFMWVAGMSAVVGIALGLAFFLFEQLMFKTTVTGKLDDTASTLTKNNKETTALMDNLRARSTDEGLNSVKALPDDQALQVVLDALPADDNSLALGSSLQQKLLSGVTGVVLESLSVDSANQSTAPAAGKAPAGVEKITLSFVATADNPSSLKDLLVRLERSLRVIDIDTLSLETSATRYTMTVTAHAYYKPGVQVKLGTAVCKPDGKGCK